MTKPSHKTARDINDPGNAKDVERVVSSVADVVVAAGAARGFNRQAAGALALRAVVEILLRDASAATVGAWLIEQGRAIERLGGEVGHG